MIVSSSKYFKLILWGLILHLFLSKISYFKSLILWDYFDEFLLLALLPLFIRGIISDNNLIRFRIYYLIYLLIGLLTAIFNNVPIESSIVQTLFELKFPLLFISMIGFGNVGNEELMSVLKHAIKAITILNIPFVIFQFLYPNQYNEIFSAGGHRGVFIFNESHFVRAAGIFWHQYQLAFFSVISIGYLWFIEGKKITNIWILLNLVLLILTMQRQEIVSFIFAFVVCQYLINSQFKDKKTIFILKTAMVLIPLSLIFLPLLNNFIENSMLLNLALSHDPRLVFYYKSFQLFFESFPFGLGFGTYGGYAAFHLNPEIYQKLNFDNYIWYRQNQFMTDTFYPHVIAETGFFGIIFFILAIKSILNYFRKFIHSKHNNYAIFSYFSMIFIVMVSLTSPNFNDVFCLFLTFISVSFLRIHIRYNY